MFKVGSSPASDKGSEELEQIFAPMPNTAVGGVPSPRVGRKRANDEIYTSKSSTNGHSKKTSVNQRPSTAPEQGQKNVQSSQFATHGFARVTPHHPATQSVRSAAPTLTNQDPDDSAAVTAPSMPQPCVKQLQDLQAQLDREYNDYVKELEGRDHKAPLEAFDWDNLEDRYLGEMEAAIQEEQEIHAQIANRYKEMLVWMQTASEQEAERAVRRLRTRMAAVEDAEEQLNHKEAHYGKVLSAFQSTMALLNGP